jgi:hypothetical protein
MLSRVLSKEKRQVKEREVVKKMEKFIISLRSPVSEDLPFDDVDYLRYDDGRLCLTGFKKHAVSLHYGDAVKEIERLRQKFPNKEIAMELVTDDKI